MARPAIVIGLGGTGQWVLTYLKKDLIETHQGTMPDNVKLLSFDTMPEASVAAKLASSEGSKKDIAVGAIRLEPKKEFFGLTGNGYQLGDQVVRGQAPHIGHWFDAEFYRQQQQPALWDLASGAGQVRQFGRLALFMKIDEIIWNSIRQAFMSVKAQVQKGNELEVIIIASFAGGTGAGMFVDTGIICRSLADIVSNNLIIRGFFVLPRAFTQGGQLGLMDNHMLARSFAAWRELERFMNIGPDYGAPRVEYKPNDQNLSFNLSIRPFDQCYIVDSRRASHSLENISPEHGVHPSIADFISTVIDEQSGVIYTQDAINIAGVAQAQNKTIGYSALGTYTVKVPIYYAMQEYALSFTRDLMELWLAPERDANGKLFRLATNQNREAGIGTKQGRDAAIEFLQSPTGVPRRVGKNGSTIEPLSVGQSIETIQNSIFMPRLAQVYAMRLKDDAKALEGDALGGHTMTLDGQIDPATYIGVFSTLPTDFQNTQIIYENRSKAIDLMFINGEALASVWDFVPPSKEFGEHPSEGPLRFDQQIPVFERTHFGAGGSRGDFGVMLDQMRLFQIARFRDMLQQWTLNTLNGTSANIVDQRSGKLGFVIDFYQELVKICDYFADYIEAVLTRRGTKELRNTQIAICEQTKATVLDWAEQKCIFFFEHPRAHITQRQYLQAVDDMHTIIKDDMLLSTLSQTALEMRKIAQIALENAQKWANTLVFGTDNTTGAYRTLLKELDNVRATRVEDQKAAETQLMLKMNDYARVKLQTEIDRQMERFQWDIDTTNGFGISCSVLSPIRQVDGDGNMTYANRAQALSLDDTAYSQEQNVRLLSSIGRYVYREEPAKHRIIEEIMQITDPNYANYEVFAHDVQEYSEPLLDISAAASQTSIVKWMYLRLKHQGISNQVTEYVNNVHSWLKEHTSGALSNPNNLKIVPSENEHKITMIQLWDNVQQSDFLIWNDLQNAYKNHILSGTGYENAARLHIFPAECNAASYESRLPTLLKHKNIGHRIFHPRVVMLLDDDKRTSLFFRCYAYGFIKRSETEIGEKSYFLDVPAKNRFIEQYVNLTRPYDREGNIRTEWPSIFEVMNAFNFGKDINNPQNQIVWQDLRNVIVITEKDLRSRNELEKRITQEIDRGLVHDLRRRSSEIATDAKRMNQVVPVWGWRKGQEYEDLADLAEMMYLEVVRDQTPELRDRIQ